MTISYNGPERGEREGEMSNTPTKERILREGLRLFGERGYRAVSMEQIAAAVGIKAPSLYKHFPGKKAIFQAVIQEMKERHARQMLAMQMRGGAREDTNLFLNLGEDQLIGLGKQLFAYYLHDEAFSLFRKMLTMGQYADPEVASLLVSQCMAGPLDYNEQLFGMMMGAGFFVPAAPKVMALHFYAPIYMLLLICDVHPEREAESLQTLEEHIRQFNRNYVKTKE